MECEFHSPLAILLGHGLNVVGRVHYIASLYTLGAFHGLMPNTVFGPFGGAIHSENVSIPLVAMASNRYSPVEEAHRIFALLCNQSVQLNLPSATAQIKDTVSFTSRHNQIYYPIPLKVTETLAALKGIEGVVAAAVADLRFGPLPGGRKVSVDLEKATVFGFEALIAKVDGLSRAFPGVKSKLKGRKESLFLVLGN